MSATIIEIAHPQILTGRLLERIEMLRQYSADTKEDLGFAMEAVEIHANGLMEIAQLLQTSINANMRVP